MQHLDEPGDILVVTRTLTVETSDNRASESLRTVETAKFVDYRVFDFARDGYRPLDRLAVVISEGYEQVLEAGFDELGVD